VANVKFFIDFWNFQLGWNDNMRPEANSGEKFVRIGWRDLPSLLMNELPSVLGGGAQLVFKGVNVYASVNPQSGSKDEKLKGFLHNNLGQMTGYNVKVVDRKAKHDDCPHCNARIDRQVEKGVDVSIVTDLFEGAVNNSYDIAILLSSDSDFVPGVQTIQERLNRQVVHVGFKQGGDQVRTTCWGHIILDGDVANKIADN